MPRSLKKDLKGQFYMQIFLSWSGSRSKQVAQLLNDWLPRVVQSLNPWISTRDIDKGSLWSEVIGDQLKGMTTGIICLTKENKERPWILFEAGALAKGLSSNRVCTLLIDLEPSDIEPPLSQFHHTSPHHKDDMLNLLQTLNDRLNEHKLRSSILENALEVQWPYFEEQLEKILEETPVEENIPARTEQDILREILENTRSLKSRVNFLEKNQINNLYIEKKAEDIDFCLKYPEVVTYIKEIKRIIGKVDHKVFLDNLSIAFPSVDEKILKEILSKQ